MPLKALVFDKDGTLFDFATTWEVWAEAFLLRATNGDRPRAERIGADIGFDLACRKFTPGSIVVAGTVDEIVAVLLPHFCDHSHTSLFDMLNEEAAQITQVEAVPLIPLLQSFRATGLKLGVATNDAEMPARAHLDAAGVTDLFDFIAGFDSGFGGKPAPGQLLAFADAVGVAATDCAMVGDSTHDLQAGRAAGMACVGVLTGLAGRETLAPFADVVLDNIGQLPAWLDAHRR